MREIITDKVTVRRFLLETQLLWNQHPTADTASSIIRHLECIQIDPVAAVERNHHLVLHARKPNYKTEELENLISSGNIFEYFANAACFIPIEDFPIFRLIRDKYSTQLHSRALPLQAVMNDIVHRLRQEGPLPSRAFQSATKVKGYWDNKAAKTKDTTLALNLLYDMGEITVDSRNGSEKYFIPTDMKIPSELLDQSKKMDEEKAKESLDLKYMRAYRVFDFEDMRFGWYKKSAKERKELRDRLLEKQEIIPLKIEGVNTQYYILHEDLETFQEMSKDSNAKKKETVRFLPPLDNLIWRRPRVKDLFDFDYKWEIYFPESKREYGYYAMPILYGDALIGRMDPRILSNEQALSIKLLQLEGHIKITKKLLKNLKKGLHAFAKFHHASSIVIEKTIPEQLKKELEM